MSSAPSVCQNVIFFEKKLFKCREKLSYLGFFGLEFEKPSAIFEISSLKFVNLQHFVKKIMSKFGTKNALLGIFGLEFEEKLLSYLKSALSNLSNCKISRKKRSKMSKFGTKNALFEYFWDRI